MDGDFMNSCAIMCKVLNLPNFDFLFMSKKTSIAFFWAELSNKSIVKVYGFDDVADDIFKNINENDVLLIDGVLRCVNNTLEIEIVELLKLY